MSGLYEVMRAGAVIGGFEDPCDALEWMRQPGNCRYGDTLVRAVDQKILAKAPGGRIVRTRVFMADEEAHNGTTTLLALSDYHHDGYR